MLGTHEILWIRRGAPLKKGLFSLSKCDFCLKQLKMNALSVAAIPIQPQPCARKFSTIPRKPGLSRWGTLPNVPVFDFSRKQVRAFPSGGEPTGERARRSDVVDVQGRSTIDISAICLLWRCCVFAKLYFYFTSNPLLSGTDA